MRNINIRIKSPRPNSSKEPPKKEGIETSEFRRPRKRWSNGCRARSLFRTPERGADEREKKTIEGTERTALEEAMASKDARDRGILNPTHPPCQQLTIRTVVDLFLERPLLRPIRPAIPRGRLTRMGASTRLGATA